MFDRINQGLYWDRLWRLVDGCTPCSPGCRGCWSAAYTHRYYFVDGLTCYGHANESTPKKSCRWPQFNGHYRLRRDNLDLPLRTRKPQAWLILNDLFHEDVPLDFIAQAFNSMRMRRHIFLILTKRPIKMRVFLESYEDWFKFEWPNIWLGVTVCNQQEADEKIPILRSIPAAVRFISVEPMLEQIDLCLSPGFEISAPYGDRGIHWAILGGESGPGARPMHPDWARSIINQCKSAGVPIFIKQIHVNGKMNKNISEWPEALRVRELPKIK